MSFIILFDRFCNKIVREYRRLVFKKKINCTHNNFSLVGKINIINRNITLGKNATIYPDCMFYGDGPIKIGDSVDIGQGTIIYASRQGGVTIGNNSMIAAQCFIIDTDHGTAAGKLIRDQNNSVDKVVIGEDVWLGANVTVLKGSIIEDGAIIGAKSLVKGKVEAGSINVGIPCKKLKMRE